MLTETTYLNQEFVLEKETGTQTAGLKPGLTPQASHVQDHADRPRSLTVAKITGYSTLRTLSVRPVARINVYSQLNVSNLLTL